MSQLTYAVRRNPRRTWVTAGVVLVLLLAFALVWIGRATAGGAGPTQTHKIAKTVSNLATGKADAVDADGGVCTNSTTFADMPGMTETFSFGGTASRPVLVFFQGQVSNLTETFLIIRLTIDGVVQSGPAFVAVDERENGEPDESETHGFNFISDPMAPGTHTASIQWRLFTTGSVCVGHRSLIVLHK